MGKEREEEDHQGPFKEVQGGPRVAATSPPLNLPSPNQDQGPKITQFDTKAESARN